MTDRLAFSQRMRETCLYLKKSKTGKRKSGMEVKERALVLKKQSSRLMSKLLKFALGLRITYQFYIYIIHVHKQEKITDLMLI